MTKANEGGKWGEFSIFPCNSFLVHVNLLCTCAHTPTHHRVKYQGKQSLAQFLLLLLRLLFSSRLLLLNFDFSILNLKVPFSIATPIFLLISDSLLAHIPPFPCFSAQLLDTVSFFIFFLLQLIYRVFPFFYILLILDDCFKMNSLNFLLRFIYLFEALFYQSLFSSFKLIAACSDRFA